jgi:hypothetical protein
LQTLPRAGVEGCGGLWVIRSLFEFIFFIVNELDTSFLCEPIDIHMTTQRAELHNTAQQRTPSAQHVTDTAAPHVAHGMPAFTDS